MSTGTDTNPNNEVPNLDKITNLDQSKVIPEALRPEFDKYSAEIGYDKSNDQERIDHGRAPDPHPMPVFLVVQWLIAEARASPRPNYEFFSPVDVKNKHAAGHDKDTYKDRLKNLCSHGVLIKTERGGTPSYTLPEDVELAPAFQLTDEGDLPDVTIENESKSTSVIYNFLLPAAVETAPQTLREWFEDRYTTGYLLFVLSFGMTGYLAETTFDPHSPVLQILWFLMAFGAIAMIVGGLEMTKEAYDRHRKPV